MGEGDSATALALGDDPDVGLAPPVAGVAPHAATKATSTDATTGTSPRNISCVYLSISTSSGSAHASRVVVFVPQMRAAVATRVGRDNCRSVEVARCRRRLVAKLR